MNEIPSFADDQPSTSGQQQQRSHRRSGNEVIWVGNPSWRAMIPVYIRGTLIALIFVALALGLKFAGVLSMFMVILIILLALTIAWGSCYFIQRMTIYTLTRARVLKKSGIINIRKEQARLEMITNIIIDRSLWQRIAGIGDLDIDTANDSSESLVWWGVRDPYKVESLIDSLRAGDYDQIEEEQDPDFRY